MNVADQLIAINHTLGQIQLALANPPFWQSNIFAAIIGFSGGLLVFGLDKTTRILATRKRELAETYQWLLGQLAFDTPAALLSNAKSTVYMHTSTRGGRTIHHPEKSTSEKMLIALRRHIKYWTYPRFSKIKRLFKKYERVITKFPEWNNTEIQVHIDRAQEAYDKIEQYLYDQTGENRFTS
jgi:hypothetical protein